MTSSVPLTSEQGVHIGELRVIATVSGTNARNHAELAEVAAGKISTPAVLQASPQDPGTLLTAVVDQSDSWTVLLGRLEKLDGIVRVLDIVAEVGNAVVSLSLWLLNRLRITIGTSLGKIGMGDCLGCIQGDYRSLS